MGKHKKKCKKSSKHRTRSESSDEWEEAPLETARETSEASRSKAHSGMRKPVDVDDDDDELASSRESSRLFCHSGSGRHSRKKDQPSWRKRDYNQKHLAPKSDCVYQSKQNDVLSRQAQLSLENKRADFYSNSVAKPVLSKKMEDLLEVSQNLMSPAIHSKKLTAQTERENSASEKVNISRDASNLTKTKETSESETPEVLSDDKMNKLSAKILKAELRGDMETAKSLKSKLDLAMEARSMVDRSNEQESTSLVVVLRDKSRGSDKGKRNSSKAERRAERKKICSEDNWQSLENKFVRTKVERDEAADVALQRAKRVLELGSNPTMKNHEEDKVHFDSDSPGHHLVDKVVKEHSRSREYSNSCPFCIESTVCVRHLIIHEGENASLMLPRFESLTDFHCLIVPREHLPALTLADDDTWSEIQQIRQILTRMFAAEGMDCIFLQTVTEFSKRSHASMQCIPIPNEAAEMIPMYFRKAIEESETEWTMNKKLVHLSKGGVRSCIPKGLPYFSVDFGEQNGFGHVIEDRTKFPEYFGLEIIGGLLDVSPSVWLKPLRESFADQSKKVLNFERLWSSYGASNKIVRVS